MNIDEGDLEIEGDDEFEPLFEEQDVAILVTDLHKRYRNLYRSEVVLNGLNLKCPIGKIYILYGTGKSGKSAVVKSILNIESFSRGAIAVFSKDHSDDDLSIGYMPQLIGLDSFLTAIETIHYFAGLQKVDKHKCVKNFSVLQSPMTMASYNILVNDLTEDQRRVLSFYIAMMASPKLLILDQPIAGCDPLYRNFFWQKLRTLVDNDGTTVFMTCSDEIDVKYADVVGYLKNGIITIEEPPAALMKRLNIWSFHDLILSITVAELKEFQIIDAGSAPKLGDDVSIKSGGFVVTHFTSNDDDPQRSKINLDSSFGISEKSSKPCCASFKLRDVLAELRILISWQILTSLRNYVKVIYHLLLPVFCVLFYAYCVGSEISEVNLGIVHCGNNSGTSCRQKENPICVFESRISDKYLNKRYYENYDKASTDVENGKLNALLLLNEDPTNGTFDDNKKFGCGSIAFETTNIVLELDASSKLIRSHIIDQLSRAYGFNSSDNYPLIPAFRMGGSSNSQNCLVNCPVTPFISNFKSNGPEKYETEVALLIWGAIATITHFSGAIMGALPLCVQNRNGLLDRMKMMGITQFKLHFVHWVTRTVFIVVQTFLMIITAIVYLDGEFSAYRFFIGWIVMLFQTLCGFSFGILLYGLLKKRMRIFLYVVILELFVSSISGFFWTYHGLSTVFQKITVALPHFSVARLLHKVVIQNIGVDNDYIWIGLVSPLFWMISACVIYCVYVELKK